jgi:hypothetical protein
MTTELATLTILLAGGFMGAGLMILFGACYVVYLLLTLDE